MRDPARIRRILAKLAQVWESSPDQRLGQLIFNLYLPDDPVSDIWNKEDSDWETLLDEYLKTGKFRS
jgi:hypothetical protein